MPLDSRRGVVRGQGRDDPALGSPKTEFARAFRTSDQDRPRVYRAAADARESPGTKPGDHPARNCTT